MAFVRVRTINGKQYVYQEARWREGGKVRSRSKCLGAIPGGDVGWLRRQLPPTHGVNWDAIERQELARVNADDARHASRHAQLYAAYGLKAGPSVTAEEQNAAESAEQEEASPEGEGEVSETQGL